MPYVPLASSFISAQFFDLELDGCVVSLSINLFFFFDNSCHSYIILIEGHQYFFIFLMFFMHISFGTYNELSAVFSVCIGDIDLDLIAVVILSVLLLPIKSSVASDVLF